MQSPVKAIAPQQGYLFAMIPTGDVDVRGGSGRRKLTGDSDDEGQGRGIRGASPPRRGGARCGTAVVDLCDAYCQTHRLHARSSRSAEILAAVRNFGDCRTTVATLRE